MYFSLLTLATVTKNNYYPNTSKFQSGDRTLWFCLLVTCFAIGYLPLKNSIQARLENKSVTVRLTTIFVHFILTIDYKGKPFTTITISISSYTHLKNYSTIQSSNNLIRLWTLFNVQRAVTSQMTGLPTLKTWSQCAMTTSTTLCHNRGI